MRKFLCIGLLIFVSSGMASSRVERHILLPSKCLTIWNNSEASLFCYRPTRLVVLPGNRCLVTSSCPSVDDFRNEATLIFPQNILPQHLQTCLARNNTAKLVVTDIPNVEECDLIAQAHMYDDLSG